MECGTHSDRVAARTPEQAPSTRLGGLLGLQTAAGNAAVVQMLREASHPWAQQQNDQAEPALQRSAVHDVLRTSGRPLDEATRTDMESRLGADFSDVRIHNDVAAKASAAEVGARAYTSGSHVVIGDGGGDKHTLAHELTHVIQQRQDSVAGTDNGSGLKVSDPSDRFEREAEANATRAMSGSIPLQRQEHAAQTAPSGTGTEPVQRALTINGHKISEEYKKETENQPLEDQKNKLEVTVHAIVAGINAAKQGGELTEDEWQQIHGAEKRILEQLRKLIVSPVGEKGLNKVLGVEVGKHPDFGAKNRDVQVNDYAELARGLMGWVDAKENRKKEKAAATEIRVSRGVDILLNSLLLRINGCTERIKSNMNSDEQRQAMEHELVHGVAHELAAGGAARAGQPFGAYLTYFNPVHDPQSKFRPGEALAHLATTVPGVGGGIQAVLRSPESFPFREKIMVLHDLMEYFGPARHFPPTMGTDRLTDIGVDDTWSTSSIDPATGVRNQQAQDRGQNPRKWQGGKEHPSTRNENSDTTKLARAHKAPVWAGQSYTAARMFNLARDVGGTPQEIAAVAWGIFAFWRVDFDHTTAFAYHTLHEVMDIAQNFGVPYKITDQYAGREDLKMSKLENQLRMLQGEVTGGRELVRNAIDILERTRTSDTVMWTDEYDQAVSTAEGISVGLEDIAKRLAELAGRLASPPAERSRAETELAQALQESLARIPAEFQRLSDLFAPVLAKAKNP
ncbi:DUF4157 domain-containing protein [Streptomyces violascens]|uniref:DUF4157 domain-containing protein n=1 Tax=Streptomyces violascens TaxID=67381 RepID=UPI0037AAC978